MYKSQASFMKCLIQMWRQDAASNENIGLPWRHSAQIRRCCVCGVTCGAGDGTCRSGPASHSGLGTVALAVHPRNSAAQPSPGHTQLPQSQARCLQRTYKKRVVGSYVFLIQRKPGPAPIRHNISWCREWGLEKSRSIYS